MVLDNGAFGLIPAPCVEWFLHEVEIAATTRPSAALGTIVPDIATSEIADVEAAAIDAAARGQHTPAAAPLHGAHYVPCSPPPIPPPTSPKTGEPADLGSTSTRAPTTPSLTLTSDGGALMGSSKDVKQAIDLLSSLGVQVSGASTVDAPATTSVASFAQASGSPSHSPSPLTSASIQSLPAGLLMRAAPSNSDRTTSAPRLPLAFESSSRWALATEQRLLYGQAFEDIVGPDAMASADTRNQASVGTGCQGADRCSPPTARMQRLRAIRFMSRAGLSQAHVDYVLSLVAQPMADLNEAQVRMQQCPCDLAAGKPQPLLFVHATLVQFVAASLILTKGLPLPATLPSELRLYIEAHDQQAASAARSFAAGPHSMPAILHPNSPAVKEVETGQGGGAGATHNTTGIEPQASLTYDGKVGGGSFGFLTTGCEAWASSYPSLARTASSGCAVSLASAGAVFALASTGAIPGHANDLNSRGAQPQRPSSPPPFMAVDAALAKCDTATVPTAAEASRDVVGSEHTMITDASTPNDLSQTLFSTPRPPQMYAIRIGVSRGQNTRQPLWCSILRLLGPEDDGVRTPEGVQAGDAGASGSFTIQRTSDVAIPLLPSHCLPSQATVGLPSWWDGVTSMFSTTAGAEAGAKAGATDRAASSPVVLHRKIPHLNDGVLHGGGDRVQPAERLRAASVSMPPPAEAGSPWNGASIAAQACAATSSVGDENGGIPPLKAGNAFDEALPEAPGLALDAVSHAPPQRVFDPLAFSARIDVHPSSGERCVKIFEGSRVWRACTSSSSPTCSRSHF